MIDDEPQMRLVERKEPLKFGNNKKEKRHEVHITGTAEAQIQQTATSLQRVPHPQPLAYLHPAVMWQNKLGSFLKSHLLPEFGCPRWGGIWSWGFEIVQKLQEKKQQQHGQPAGSPAPHHWEQGSPEQSGWIVCLLLPPAAAASVPPRSPAPDSPHLPPRPAAALTPAASWPCGARSAG